MGDLQGGRRRWASRVGWMAVLWAIGVAALAFVAHLLRLVMGWAGFNS